MIFNDSFYFIILFLIAITFFFLVKLFFNYIKLKSITKELESLLTKEDEFSVKLIDKKTEYLNFQKKVHRGNIFILLLFGIPFSLAMILISPIWFLISGFIFYIFISYNKK
ncbi:MAG: hypothetical protein CMG61_03875 [Candidatus Marinimicrobia bacterium]|nr:hypothetical protein [Candidatus Neomarinimicrobiota bacterium]|tara:strand:- start:2235 stop:2567 length:333 start_codon:yes stop_codon:yes gene_type:complete